MHIPRPHIDDFPLLETESGHKIPVYDLLEIQPDKISSYLCEQAEWQAVILFSHGKWKLGVEQLKRRVEEIEAAVYIELHTKMAGQKATVDLLKSFVIIDDRVKVARNKLREAQKVENAFESMRHAMQTRKDMLIQLGADVRLDKKQSA